MKSPKIHFRWKPSRCCHNFRTRYFRYCHCWHIPSFRRSRNCHRNRSYRQTIPSRQLGGRLVRSVYVTVHGQVHFESGHHDYRILEIRSMHNPRSHWSQLSPNCLRLPMIQTSPQRRCWSALIMLPRSPKTASQNVFQFSFSYPQVALVHGPNESPSRWRELPSM